MRLLIATNNSALARDATATHALVDVEVRRLHIAANAGLVGDLEPERALEAAEYFEPLRVPAAPMTDGASTEMST